MTRRTRRSRTASLFACLIVVAAACGDSTAPLEATGAGNGLQDQSGPTPVVLDAIIEPEHALVEDFEGGWTLTDLWYVEAQGVVSSGCEPFDRLTTLGDWGGSVTVWRRGDRELVHRATDVNWEALTYLESARELPGTCSRVEVDGVVVDVSKLDSELAEAVGYSLSAHPMPEGPEGEQISFDVSRGAVVALIARENVISSLVLSTDEGSAHDEVTRLVEVMQSYLSAAPVEAVGPFPKPAPPPQATGTTDPVTLRLGGSDCRNDGTLEAAGVTWELADPVPLSWRGQVTVTGSITMAGTTAMFRAEDGTTLSLSSDGVSAECIGWEDDDGPSTAEVQEFGRLDCSPGSLLESREPDAGQPVDDIARAASQRVVRVEPGQPLQWWGIDENDRVVVGITLGDAPGADYQVFTCDG